jgi:hypothetical protein
MEENKTANESMSPIPPPLSGDHSYLSHNYSSDNRYGTKFSMDDSALPQYSQEYYPTLSRTGSHGSFSRHSLDDSNYIDARMQKLIQSEAAIREEMFRECTFRPKIKGLPTTYGPMKEHGTPFIVRSQKWIESTEKNMKKKSKAVEESMLRDCTFRPRINSNSASAIKEIRGDSPSEKANDRLFVSYKIMQEQKERMRKDHIINEERLEELECTFQPILETRENPAFQHVNPKFLLDQTARKLKDKQNLDEKYYKDFTFTPKVNKIRPTMSAAKMYTSMNVVDRLTKPIQSQASGDDSMRAFDNNFEGGSESPSSSNKNGMVMDAATFIGSLQGGSVGNADSQNHSSVHQYGGKTASSSEMKKIDKEEFDKFLQRQHMVLQKREQNIKSVERAITPNFKPKLNRKSIEISNNAQVPGFLARLERDVERRKAAEQVQEIGVDPDATFKPTINKRAAKQRSRSSFEMSRGDLMKKETNRRMLKLQMEQEEMSKMTFKPQISHRAREYGRSALKVNEDPSEFLKWTKGKQEEKERQRQEELRRRDEEIARECTFTPKTSQCPAYITRIAESMKNFKSARSSISVTSEKMKPDWR